MRRGNTELSRETRPILRIEAHDHPEQQYAVNRGGVTIDPYDEMGDAGDVPWVAVFKKGEGCIYRVRADRVAIFYSLQYGDGPG